MRGSRNYGGQYRDIYIPNVLHFMRNKLLKDSDNDGLKDIHEFANDTDTQLPDTDGDGLLDGFEVKHGFDPLNTNESCTGQ